jgi:hypothetical protein
VRRNASARPIHGMQSTQAKKWEWATVTSASTLASFLNPIKGSTDSLPLGLAPSIVPEGAGGTDPASAAAAAAASAAPAAAVAAGGAASTADGAPKAKKPKKDKPPKEPKEVRDTLESVFTGP